MDSGRLPGSIPQRKSDTCAVRSTDPIPLLRQYSIGPFSTFSEVVEVLQQCLLELADLEKPLAQFNLLDKCS
jgi:hypothetical protein